MTPRIAPPDSFDDEQTEILSKTLLDEEGRPLNVFATLAHHPRLLRRFNALGGLFLAKGELPARQRELVILRVAVRTGCEYEFGQHVVIGARSGLHDDELRRTAETGTMDGWDDGDRALLTFTDELLASDVVSDSTWDDVMRLHGYTTPQMVELTMLVGFYRMLAGFLNSAGVPLERDMAGWPT